ncbi:STAS domain-containing protein [Parasphingorhabdus pacifica]
MLTHTPVTEQSEHSPRPSRPATTRPAEYGRLRLRMDCTDPQLAVLAVIGELDTVTTPQLAEVLWPRLQTKLTTLVFDLSEVTFLGVDALQLLARAHSYATYCGTTLCVINSTPTVERALAAASLDTTLPCFASLLTARTALATRAEGTLPIGHQRIGPYPE